MTPEQMKKMMGKPNFIIIHTDQQRADSIRAYGHHSWAYTPVCDSIAEQGVRFDNCYSTCPVCIPQRLSLLTGQSAQKHGVFDNVGIPDLELETTFPLEMAKGGYKTALIGRTMHTYPFDNPYGFEDYMPGDPTTDCRATDGFLNFVNEYAPKGCGGINGNGTYNNSRFAAPYSLDNRFHQTMWATTQAVDYIQQRRRDRKPFMLMVGYYAPHAPFNPPREWMDYYMGMDLKDERNIGDYDIKPDVNGSMISGYVDVHDEEYKRIRAGYYGNVSFIDAQVGRLFNEITAMPNTYVIFTSDHGEMLGDHYHMHKSAPYQGAVHIPFMICGPGIAGNRVCRTVFTWQDIMPTVLEMAGLPVPDSCDGISFVKTILGQRDENASKERDCVHGESRLHVIRDAGYERQKALFAEGKEYNWSFDQGFHYITDGNYKYIWFNKSGAEQLFDLQADYGEQHDLSQKAEYQDLLIKYRKLLIAELKDRPEGFTDGEKLIAGIDEPQLSPEMDAFCEKRMDEDRMIYYYPKSMMRLAMSGKAMNITF